MNIFKFVVPGKPFSKERPRFSNGRAYTPATTKIREHYVLECFQKELEAQKLTESPCYNEHIRLDVVFVLADKRRRDIDNMVKLVQDALNKKAYEDDCQIQEIRAKKIYSVEGDQRTEVSLRWSE